MTMLRAVLIAAVFAGSQAAKATDAGVANAKTQVLVVGLFHLSNPGQDIANVVVDDVLQPEKQRQLQDVLDALAKFQPTLVAVEWPSDVVDERYSLFLDGTLPPSRNEVVQLGFRLARQAGLKRVHGIDVDGDFPFEAVQKWANANGMGAKLSGMIDELKAMTARISAEQKTRSIGMLLREYNSPAHIARSQSFYGEMSRFGRGEKQPGAKLNTAWAERNYLICAKFIQALSPGDRAVIFYGGGHTHALQRCVIDTPDLELVDAAKYLP